MKRKLQIAVILVLCLFCAVSFSACGEEIDIDKASAIVDECLTALSVSDYETVESHVHPDYSDKLDGLFDKIEKEYDIDLNSGITYTEITTYSSINTFQQIINSPKYKATAKGISNGKELIITIEVLDNKNGIGICDINIEYASADKQKV